MNQCCSVTRLNRTTDRFDPCSPSKAKLIKGFAPCLENTLLPGPTLPVPRAWLFLDIAHFDLQVPFC